MRAYCKDRPLDREAFRDPALYLRREVRAPSVALGSRIIVQRHVNALLFGTYMRERGGNSMTLQAGQFFGCGEAVGAVQDVNDRATQMAAWIRGVEARTALAHPITALTRASVLRDDSGVYEAAATALDQARAGFVSDWRVIQDLAVGIGSGDKTARTRLEIHLKRLCQDFLLGVLASRGFLPGHGFPTDVVSFVIRKDDPLARDSSEAEDSNRFNAYPQRSLDSAIREYAPGSEVVVDGLVHKSAGVTLNWKQPASESGVREIQALMWRWRCRACGESGSDRHFDPAAQECPSCGADSAQWFEYLQPAGFAVDLREDPHANADAVTFVPPEPTTISAAGAPWISLFDPARGRRRSAREGSVFYCNAGPGRVGYAICLNCGRADAPAGQPHRQLLGKGECEGALRSFSRKEGLRLGYEIHTDVFEFQPAGWDQPGGALALTVAMREALARRLGVSPDEMGLSAEPRRDLLGGFTQSIFLHDKATGGAGFSAQAEDLFADIIHDAQTILDCAVPGCLSACPACVLVGDLSEDQAGRINRRPALELIRSTLLADAAPGSADRAAPDARFSRSVLAELDRALESGGVRVTLRLDGLPDPAALERFSAATLLEKWRARGKHLVVAAGPEMLAGLDGAQKLRLRDLVNGWGVDLETGDVAAFANGSRFLAEVVGPAGRSTVFATRDSAAIGAGPAWGLPTEAPVVRFAADRPYWTGAPVPIDSLRADPGAAVVHIGREFDGRVGGFGAKMSNALRALAVQVGASTGDAIIALDYEDRYVRSPLTMRLLIEAFHALTRGAGKSVPLIIRTIPLEPKDQIARYLDSDWKSEADRADVAKRLATANGLALDWRTDSAGHARRLTATFASGRRVRILLDQGFGPWRCDRGTTFEFRAPATEQAARLRQLDTGVQMAPGAHTYFVAEVLPAPER